MTQEDFFKRFKYNPKIDQIGSGGFGKVYKAYDDYRDRHVAIKIAEVKEGYEHLSLETEVKLSKQLEVHKNIAYYENSYRFEMHNGIFDYGVLQYYPDGNLSKVIQKDDLTEYQKTSIAEGIINGLAFLHSNNILHRDLKSSNILISKKGQEYIPKITDFGLSKSVSDIDKSAYNNSFVGGSIKYSAPEQLLNNKIKSNVDIWSLGVILYELFKNKLPFAFEDVDGHTDYQKNHNFNLINSGLLPEDVNDIHSPFNEIISKSLVIDPDLRLQSIKEVVEILNSHHSEKIISDNTFVKGKKDSTAPLDLKLPLDVVTSAVPQTIMDEGKTSLKVKRSKLTPVFATIIVFFTSLGLAYFLLKPNVIIAQNGNKYTITDKKGKILSSKSYEKVNITLLGNITAIIGDTLFYIDNYGQEKYYNIVIGSKKNISNNKIAKEDSTQQKIDYKNSQPLTTKKNTTKAQAESDNEVEMAPESDEIEDFGELGSFEPAKHRKNKNKTIIMSKESGGSVIIENKKSKNTTIIGGNVIIEN